MADSSGVESTVGKEPLATNDAAAADGDASAGGSAGERKVESKAGDGPSGSAQQPAAVAGAAATGPANNLRADAPAFEFKPSGRPLEDPGNVRAKLPQSTLKLLRQCWLDQSGTWVSYYIGRLKSYNHRNGYGFLECSQSFKDYGSDIFIHKNFVPNPWHIGQPCEFAVMPNPRGQPQAADVMWLPRLPQPKVLQAVQPSMANSAVPRSAAPSGVTVGPAASSAGPAPAAAASAVAPGTSAAAASAPAPAPPPRYLGTLKSFSPAQSYGFIVCEEVFKITQRDIYFDKSQLPTTAWRFGQTVEFNLTYNARGQPQARMIDWDPVPHLSADPNAGQVVQPPQQQPQVRNHTSSTHERLRRLMGLLQGNDKETALVTAIDMQGGSGNAGQGAEGAAGGNEAGRERDIDYVTFVLDRLGPEVEAAKDLKDFVQMLLALMLAKMLQAQADKTRFGQIVRWFDMLSKTIDSNGNLQQFQDVVAQIHSHLNSASQLNQLMNDSANQETIFLAFNRLQEKAEANSNRARAQASDEGQASPAAGAPQVHG